jgi:hypothetical protein
MKERNPNPINCGDPHCAARGAKMVGHSWKIPSVGRSWHPFEPPAQLSTPDSPIRDAPIITITVPVTTGGKIRLRVFAGAKESAMFRREQSIEVPNKLQ